MAKADVEKLTGLIKDLKLKDEDETKNRQLLEKVLPGGSRPCSFN